MTLEQTRHNIDRFVWDGIGSVEELVRLRMQAMEIFLEDYNGGKRRGRYVNAELPVLPFPNNSFDLALCSHFLFLYTQHFSESFHRAAILELCRVAPEVRIFPLLDLDGGPSHYVAGMMHQLRDEHAILIEPVPYEFQRGGNHMMRIRK